MRARGAQYEIRATLPATLASVEDFLRRARGVWNTESAKENFAIELLLRESLTNAVVHGCAEDPARRVCCVLRWRPSRLLFAICDGGLGFDWRSRWGRESEPDECSGRGLEIFHKYATRVRFNRPGNAVAIQKKLARGMETNDQ